MSGFYENRNCSTVNWSFFHSSLQCMEVVMREEFSMKSFQNLKITGSAWHPEILCCWALRKIWATGIFSCALRFENPLPKAYPIDWASFITTGQHIVKFTFLRAQHQLGHTDKNDPGRSSLKSVLWEADVNCHLPRKQEDPDTLWYIWRWQKNDTLSW